MRLRLPNMPVPETHVVRLIAGGILQIFVPFRLLGPGWIGHALGWPIAILGAALALWAVVAAGDESVSDPNTLVTGGPYAHSRNPMCAARS